MKMEFARVYRNMPMRLLVVFLFVANAVYLLGSQYGDWNYARLYQKQFEATRECESKTIEKMSYVASDETMSKVCDTIYQERAEFEEYPDYLETVEDNASAGLIFYDADSFAGRNAQKTLCDYAPLKSYQLVYAPSLGVNAFLNTGVTDCLILILGIFLCYFLVARDKELTVFVLFGITQKGYRRLIYKRLLLLAGIVSAVSALLYLMNFCYFGVLYGWGGLGRCVQSVYGMKDFVFPLSVGQYIIVFLVCKWLAVLFGMTVFCTSGLFVTEKVNGMDDLIAATYNGIINLYDLKRVIALVLYSLVYCVLFGTRLVSIGMVYGYPMLTADANSLMLFSYLPDGWSIELVICLLHLWYYLVGYFLLLAVLRISQQSKTRMGAMLASMGAALLVWLVLLGISVLV